MKREELIKLITDNFAEGEEVSFRYCDDQGDLISTRAFFEVDKTEVIEDCYWTLFDSSHNIIRDHVARKDLRDAIGELGHMYASSKMTVTKSKIVETKVIDVCR